MPCLLSKQKSFMNIEHYFEVKVVDNNLLSVILPGRHVCECQAAKHKLINNCTRCGRVVCDQEGSGPCLFCGHLVKINTVVIIH